MRRVLVTLSILGLAACAGRPTETLKSAETALSGAELAVKCAPDEYAAAERMYGKAQRLADEEKYEEAEAAANAAKKLAVKAKAKAEARREDCLAPKSDTISAADYIDGSGPGLDAAQDDDQGLSTIFFSYNAHELDESAKGEAAHNASWLQNRPGTQITIEGHCDSRGSTEYNLALGERRAQTARKYLVSLGVDSDRLGVISYGEEQLADYGEEGTSHARNRRAEFRVGF